MTGFVVVVVVVVVVVGDLLLLAAWIGERRTVRRLRESRDRWRRLAVHEAAKNAPGREWSRETGQLLPRAGDQ